MFRTISGQTGTDAYSYEAAQIQNCLRELNARAARLADAMATELPDDATIQWGMRGGLITEAPAKSIRGIICMSATADGAALLGQIARGLSNPTYVVSQER